LALAANNAEVRGLQKRWHWFIEQGIEPQARWLNPSEVSQLEPWAGPNFGALYQPVMLVRPAWLTKALAATAAEYGLTVATGNPAVELLTTSPTGLSTLSVKGVKLKDGLEIEADKVVVAAGSWSGLWLDTQLAKLGITSNYAQQIYPVRGQMLAVQVPTGQVPLQHVLVGGHGYAIPREGATSLDTVAFGATEEHQAGFEVHQTAEGLRELGLLVHKLTPLLEKAPVLESWAGLRPGSRDIMPKLGPVPEIPGLWLASGHFRSGILLAPASAEFMSAALLA
jgi:glycine oxidase